MKHWFIRPPGTWPLPSPASPCALAQTHPCLWAFAHSVPSFQNAFLLTSSFSSSVLTNLNITSSERPICMSGYPCPCVLLHGSCYNWKVLFICIYLFFWDASLLEAGTLPHSPEFPQYLEQCLVWVEALSQFCWMNLFSTQMTCQAPYQTLRTSGNYIAVQSV